LNGVRASARAGQADFDGKGPSMPTGTFRAANRRRALRPSQLRKAGTMPRGSNDKRERQYEHIKDSAKERGASDERAKEIAARTVNKERARSGESRTASRTSTHDMPSSRRGGQRSHSGSQGPTKDQLYNEAKKRNIDGRSKMSKKELERALGR
jgi:hypothetical protein